MKAPINCQPHMTYNNFCRHALMMFSDGSNLTISNKMLVSYSCFGVLLLISATMQRIQYCV